MDRYLGGEDIDLKMLIDDLETAVARGSFHPVLAAAAPEPGSAASSCSTSSPQAFPTPAGARGARRSPAPTATPRGRVTCDPDGPLVAEVVKTTSDPYVGRVSLVRVFSGTLRPDAPVHVSGHLTASSAPSAGTRTTTSTSGSVPSPRRSARPAHRVQCDRG